MMSEKDNKVYCTYQQSPEHAFPGHPESPQRLQSMGEWLVNPPYPQIEWLDFKAATEKEIALIHPASVLEGLRSECELGSHQFEPAPSYVTRQSYWDALSAAGATLAVTRRVLTEGKGRGFAIVRPPGHHSEPETPMGFCLLNNIAIAAADAVANGLGKVAIFDFDAHHGNGTEAVFWETEQVAYCSTHESGIYPGTGFLDSAPHAKGRIVDIPLPAFSGNTTFNRVTENIIIPWLERFQPEMLFVSAGYDAHFSDPLTSLTLDTRWFFDITQTLVELAEKYCKGRIVFVLEGGYDLIALKDNIQASLAALSGHNEYPDHYGKGPDVNVNIEPEIEAIRAFHHF
jgi:acetoin utilization deacetylase AcuC-like enzyme